VPLAVDVTQRGGLARDEVIEVRNPGTADLIARFFRDVLGLQLLDLKPQSKRTVRPALLP